MNVLAAWLFNRDHVARLNLIGRNIHLALVNQHMPVIHELPGLTPRGRKSRAIDTIVESSLQQEQKVFTRNSFLACRPFEVVSKLSFENKVDTLDLLLLTELLAVTGQSLSAAHGIPMLSGWLSATLFNRTGRFVTAISLEEEFCTFAAAQAAHRISIPSQS